MTIMDELSFMQWLKEDANILHPKPLGDGRWAGLKQMLFTWSIMTGKIGDETNVDDRWCYHGLLSAKSALDAWDGKGEPDGWHRHPVTGRRRHNGDPTTEYIAS